MPNIGQEVKRRRTFAIISHPDAGKTTITEKLILLGNLIQVAGSVKGKKADKHATSDWMAMEQQRGISVTSSVMQFPYMDRVVNLLDTPGHEDFSEDTYRVLTAVDSALMIVDGAKGVEDRTIKLMEVCRLRDTPIFTFVNKLDRDIRDAIDVLDEIETVLKIKCAPINWPLGMGKEFKGVYNLYKDTIHVYRHGQGSQLHEVEVIEGIDSDEAKALLGSYRDDFRDEIELVRGASNDFDLDAYLRGEMTPVYFGTALGNFGVKEMLDDFVEYAPAPQTRATESRDVTATESGFTGFVFKIQANMDPKHRDRLAFIKIVSGTFKRNAPYLHVRNGKKVKFSSPNTFFAEKKEIVDESFPGDIVGLHDTGNFKIGDTLTEGEHLNFKGIPSFSPEHFRYVNNADPMKSKQLSKGLDQLMDEGVAQLFTLDMNGRKIIGTVGALQYEVIQYRLEHEYGAKCSYENIHVHKACWVEAEDTKNEEFKEFKRVKQRYLAKDKQGQLVFLADSSFTIQMTQSKYPTVKLHFTSEFQ